jgi:hypothetical protein
MRGSAVTTWLRRWGPEGASPLRVAVAAIATIAPGATAVALFVFLSPPAVWDQPVLLATIATIAAVAFMAEARVKTVAAAGPLAYFDASVVLALVTLAIAGPLPAFLVWLVPDAISRATGQDYVASPGHFATVGSLALAVLAGYAVLELAAAPSMTAAMPALFTTGLVMYSVNYLFARLTFAPFYQGYRPGALIRSEYLAMLPPFTAMLVLGVATTALTGPLGPFALAPMMIVVVIPQLALAALARERSVARLSKQRAMKLYAAAITDVLALPRSERRAVAAGGVLLARSDPGELELDAWRLEELHDATLAALHVDERWDGMGRPAGLFGAWSPLASRVLSVARAWSELTAAGTVELSHSEALLDLNLRSGTEFDPQVVAAAERVIAEEQAFVRSPGFEPRLHRLPLPRPMRRTKLPTVLAHLTRAA